MTETKLWDKTHLGDISISFKFHRITFPILYSRCQKKGWQDYLPNFLDFYKISQGYLSNVLDFYQLIIRIIEDFLHYLETFPILPWRSMVGSDVFPIEIVPFSGTKSFVLRGVVFGSQEAFKLFIFCFTWQWLFTFSITMSLAPAVAHHKNAQHKGGNGKGKLKALPCSLTQNTQLNIQKNRSVLLALEKTCNMYIYVNMCFGAFRFLLFKIYTV